MRAGCWGYYYFGCCYYPSPLLECGCGGSAGGRTSVSFPSPAECVAQSLEWVGVAGGPVAWAIMDPTWPLLVLPCVSSLWPPVPFVLQTLTGDPPQPWPPGISSVFTRRTSAVPSGPGFLTIWRPVQKACYALDAGVTWGGPDAKACSHGVLPSSWRPFSADREVPPPWVPTGPAWLAPRVRSRGACGAGRCERSWESRL